MPRLQTVPASSELDSSRQRPPPRHPHPRPRVAARTLTMLSRRRRARPPLRARPQRRLIAERLTQGVSRDGPVHLRRAVQFAEREAKLPGGRWMRPPRWRASRVTAGGGHDAGDLVGLGGELDEAHAPAAARRGAGLDVDREHSLREPRPGMATGRRRRCEGMQVAGREERQLRIGRRWRASGHDLGAGGGTAGEHAVVADQSRPMKSRGSSRIACVPFHAALKLSFRRPSGCIERRSCESGGLAR